MFAKITYFIVHVNISTILGFFSLLGRQGGKKLFIRMRRLYKFERLKLKKVVDKKKRIA